MIRDYCRRIGKIRRLVKRPEQPVPIYVIWYRSSSPFTLDLSVNATSMPVGTYHTSVRVLSTRSDDSAITVSSPDAVIENSETIRVGFWIGSSDPASVFSDGVTCSEIMADAIRPYAYAHNGGNDNQIYNIHTGAVVATIPDVAHQLGPMTKSSDGADLYAPDVASQQIVAINLDTSAVGSGWDLGMTIGNPVAFGRMAYARSKGFGVVQSTCYASGYADEILDRQLAVSADGLRIIVLTPDPAVQFITGPKPSNYE